MTSLKDKQLESICQSVQNEVLPVYLASHWHRIVVLDLCVAAVQGNIQVLG
jgi:hypothetical protein